jgi:hypothetical protein
MQYLNKAILTCLTIAALVFTNGCETKKKPDEAKNGDSVAINKDSTIDNGKAVNDPQILSQLPAVSDMPYILQNTGADFNPTLINPYGKASTYTATTDKAALNLGIYGTDIGYLSVYGKTQDIINTVKSAQKLSDQLGVTQAFEASVQQRFEKNLSNKDSLTKIVNESMRAADIFLKKADRSNTASLVATGAFIEGLYIATQLVEKYPKDLKETGVLTELIKTVIDQKKSLADLIEILKNAKQDASVAEYRKVLENLHETFKASQLEEKIKTNKGDLRLTDKSIIDIANKVKEIRTKIVM